MDHVHRPFFYFSSSLLWLAVFVEWLLPALCVVFRGSPWLLADDDFVSNTTNNGFVEHKFSFSNYTIRAGGCYICTMIRRHVQIICRLHTMNAPKGVRSVRDIAWQPNAREYARLAPRWSVCMYRCKAFNRNISTEYLFF